MGGKSNYHRLPDWRARLEAFVSDQRRAIFCYGQNDCALFAAGAVEAMTGRDPAAAFRAAYSRQREGLKLVAAAGFSDHIELARSLFDSLPPSELAEPGNLAVVPATRGLALGVVQGQFIYIMGLRALNLVPCSYAVEFLEIKRCQL